MAAQDLYKRIDLLHVSLKQTAQLITGLVKTQSNIAPQSGSDDMSDVETSDNHTSLSAEIQESLKQEEEELELLQQDVEDFAPASNHKLGSRRGESLSPRASEREREHGRLIATCKRLAEELKLTRTRFRRAQLQAKKNSELAHQKEQLAYLAELQSAGNSPPLDDDSGRVEHQTHSEMRNGLLNPSRRAGRNNYINTKEDVLLTASADLTSSLRRTHDLLTSEVSRSHFAQEALVASNSALQELNKRYGTLDDLLSRSRGLLSSLLSSQKSDTWYLETAFYLLLGTVAWLLFRRLLYGPTWWLVWKPLMLIWKIIGGVLGLTAAQRGISSEQTSKIVSEIITNTPPRFTTARGTQAAGVSGRHEAESLDSGYHGYEQGPTSSWNEMVGTMIDNTRTGGGNVGESPKAHPSADGKREERAQGNGKEDDSTGAENIGREREEETRQGDVRPGEGTALRDRDPVKEPPNPKKRMWEEPPPVEKKDEL